MQRKKNPEHIGMVIVGCIVSKYILLIYDDRISAVILLKVKNSMYLISTNRVVFYIFANKISSFCSQLFFYRRIVDKSGADGYG